MMSNYLVHGTNALKGTLRYSRGDDFQYDPKSVAIYLSVACKTLSYLVEDAEALNLIATGMRGDANLQYYEFEDLLEEFAKTDHALMVASGMDSRMADYFFRDLEEMRNAVFSRRDMHQELLRERIRELQHSVCEGGLPQPGQKRNHLRRVLQVVGGGAIVMGNIAGDVIVGSAVSAFSQTYGGYIAGKGLDG